MIIELCFCCCSLWHKTFIKNEINVLWNFYSGSNIITFHHWEFDVIRNDNDIELMVIELSFSIANKIDL